MNLYEHNNQPQQTFRVARKHSSDAATVTTGTEDPGSLIAAIKNATFFYLPPSVLPPSSDASNLDEDF